MRNWLVEVWRPRSPTTCHPQAGHPGEMVSAGKFDGLRIGTADAVNPSLGAADETVKMEGVQTLDENVRNTPGRRFQTNKLLLVAAGVQGLGLLLCLTYICLHFYAPQEPPQYPPIQSIRAQFTSCDSDKGCLLTSLNKETMMVQDNSIPIKCDGFYLISVKGYFSQEISLKLYYRKNLEPLFSLNEVTFVNSVTVAFLAFKDKVYLNVSTHNASYEDIQVNGGELILIHQNPDGFCAE